MAITAIAASAMAVGYGYGGYGYGGSVLRRLRLWRLRLDPFGWYDDYYYPGTGIYVYDSYRQPHAWNDRQRRYWTSRSRRTGSTTTGGTGRLRTAATNWSGFNRTTAADGRQRD